MLRRTYRHRGIMLADAIIALAVLSLLAGTLATALVTAFTAEVDGRERAARAMESDHVLRQLSRDIRRAVPGSLRTPDTQTLEFLHLVDAGRYRVGDGTGPNGRSHTGVGLQAGAASNTFNILGRFLHLKTDAAGFLPAGYQLAVVRESASNGADDASVSGPDNRIRRINVGDEDQLRLSRPHRFPEDSPGYRLYVADGWRRYHCPAGGGHLLREEAATLSAPLDTSAMTQILIDVTACRFEIAARDDGQRVLGMQISLDADDGAGRQQLLLQSLAINVP